MKRRARQARCIANASSFVFLAKFFVGSWSTLSRLELGADERPAHNKLNTDHSDRISVHANDQDSRTVRASFFSAVLCVSALFAFR